jgi:HlyD family secretion protein
MTESSAAAEELKRALSAEEGSRLWLRRGAIVGAIAIAIAGGLVWRAKHKPAPPARYTSQTVTSGDVIEKVQATGAVQPLLQVNVGAQVNGRVQRVLVDFNSVVKRGDVLAEIDPTVYGAQVSQTQANLASQKAQLDSVKASSDNAKITLDRVERLYKENLASKADLDAARGAYNVAQANVDSIQASIGAVEAQLLQSKTNVGWTKIVSPVDGIVITRSIDPGATVVASFQTPTLFVIAQDLRKMRVLADVDEADVGKIREKMDAEAVVDAFPGESFRGIVQQLRFSPNNVQGVVTYSAIVEVENPEEKLRPGMTATVTVRTREAHNVPTVPNAALRYQPTPPLGADGKPLPQTPLPTLPKGKGRLYVLTGNAGDEKADMKIVDIGVTDGLRTELGVSGQSGSDMLGIGTKVVTDENDDDKKKKKGLF